MKYKRLKNLVKYRISTVEVLSFFPDVWLMITAEQTYGMFTCLRHVASLIIFPEA